VRSPPATDETTHIPFLQNHLILRSTAKRCVSIARGNPRA
jgi:hypothetical protein